MIVTCVYVNVKPEYRQAFVEAIDRKPQRFGQGTRQRAV